LYKLNKKEEKTLHVKPKRQHINIVFYFFNYIIDFFYKYQKNMTIAIDGKYKNIQKKDKYLIWLVKKEKVSYRFVIKRNLKTAYFL